MAGESEKIDLPADADFQCPECGGTEGLRLKKKKTPWQVFALAAIGLVVVITVLGLLRPPEGNDAPPDLPPPRLVGDPKWPGPVLGPNGLPMQILAKPEAKMFNERASGELVSPQPTNFERLFVYEQDPSSDRIQVGRTDLEADGWIPRKDTMDWPHSIVVNFRDQLNRNPVLFFRDQDDLRKLLGSTDRVEIATQFYQKIEESVLEGKLLPQDYPIISIEPGHHGQQLYIMPVVAAEFIQVNGVESRLLNVAGADDHQDGSDFHSDCYMKMLLDSRQKAEASAHNLWRIDMDVVFVVDMTGTMQPWVDGVFEAMRRIVQTAVNNGDGLVRFGLWGYQDDETLEGIQYRTKNFSPELATAKDFEGVVSAVRVNKMTADDYPEDVFAGVQDAIDKTVWRSKTRVLVLIGDAPGHTTKREGGRMDIDAPQVRQKANDAGVQIATLSIMDSSNASYAQYQPLLEEQFKQLGKNPGWRVPAYLSVNDKGGQIFQETIEKFIGALVAQSTTSDKPLAGEPLDAEGLARGILASALARVVSQAVDQSGTSEFTGWVFEQDLVDSTVSALEAKLLVTRQELNHLVGLAEDLVEKLDSASILGTNFYDKMLEAVTGAATGGRSETLKAKLPDFLKGLPYRSDIMDRSAAWFTALDKTGQDKFISSIRSKLTYYREVDKTPARWHSLSPNATANLQVAEIPLSQLP